MVHLIGLAILAIGIGLLFLRLQTNVKQIGSAETVYVQGATTRYADLPLQNYGVPLTIKQGRAKVVFPRLTPDGDVEYIYSWHYLSDIRLPKPKVERELTTELSTAIELSTIIHEHLSIEVEINQLRQQYNEVDRLANLVATSQVYGDQLDLYERAIDQINSCLSKAESLQNIYIHLIREALIGIQIANYNPNSIRDNRLQFEAQYKRLKVELQQMRDTATEYHRLLGNTFS